MSYEQWDLTPWVFRCVAVQGVRVVGFDDVDPNEPIDVWIWFAAREGEDEWFAVGLATHHDDSDIAEVEEIVRELAGEIDVLISFCGLSWDDLDGFYAEFAHHQTRLRSHLGQEGVDELLTMSRSEIEKKRLLEEEQSARELDEGSLN